MVKEMLAEDCFPLLVDLMIWTWDLVPLAMGELPFQALGNGATYTNICYIILCVLISSGFGGMGNGE